MSIFVSLADLDYSVKGLLTQIFTNIFLLSSTYIEEDVPAVVRLEPAVSGAKSLLPARHRGPRDLNQDGVGELNQLHLLLQLKHNILELIFLISMVPSIVRSE